MPTAATFIPTFTAITLLLGGFNELSVRLTLVGIFAITLHTAVTPIDLNLYPNFDDYHPSQSPFRDYVLVFGLVSLMLIALFSRIRPLVSVLVLLHLNHVLTSIPPSPLPSSSCSWDVLPGGHCKCAFDHADWWDVKPVHLLVIPSSTSRYVFLLFLEYETLADPSIGYRGRPRRPFHPSPPPIVPLPFAHLHQSMDRHCVDPRRRIPCLDHPSSRTP